MIIFKIIITCIISLILILFLKNTSPQIAVCVSILSGTMITIYMVPYIKQLFLIFLNIGNDAKELNLIFSKMLKIICIATLCEIASQLCLDAGEKFLSHKICVAGKLIILGVVSSDIVQFINYVVGLIKNL